MIKNDEERMCKHKYICIYVLIFLFFVFLGPCTVLAAEETVPVQSSPSVEIERIEFQDMRVPAYTGGAYRDTGWYRYDVENWNYTVTLGNGKVIKHTTKSKRLGFYVEGVYYEPKFTGKQSKKNPWSSESMYEVKVTIGTYKTEFLFFVLENKVVNIDFEPIYAYQKSGGKTETTKKGNKWYRYSVENWNYTVTFVNGDVIQHTDKSKRKGFYYDGAYYDVYFRDPQSYSNQWKAGKYKVKGYVGGMSSSFPFEIWNIRIKNIKVKDKPLVKESSGQLITEVNEKTGKETSFWKYPVAQYEYTVTLNNGDKIQCTSEESKGFTYNGKTYPIHFSSNQSAANPWDVGTHKATIQCGPYKGTYKIKIVQHRNMLKKEYENYYVTGSYAYIIRKREANIIAYFGKKQEVKVPAKLDGLKVTKILQYAFYENSHIERLILSEGVTTLEMESICSCPNLKYVYFPSTISAWGGFYGGALSLNLNLEEINISPKNKLLKSIEGTVYSKSMNALIFHPPASKVKKLVIPDGVEIIAPDSCRDNVHLKSVVMPDSVKDIGDWAFCGDSNLSELNISENCWYLGQYALQGTKLRTLYIPETLNTLLDSFKGMPYLESIKVSNNHPSLFSVDGVLYGEGYGELEDKKYYLMAYPSAKKDKTYRVLKGTVQANMYAFYGARNLEKVVFPKEFKTLSYSAFFSCDNLKTIVCYGKIKSIDDHVFANDHKLKNIYLLGGKPKDMSAFLKQLNPYTRSYKIYYMKGDKTFINYVKNHPKQTAGWKSVTKKKKNSMFKQDYPKDCKKAGEKHAFRYHTAVRATMTEKGKLVKLCCKCGKETTSKTVPRVKSVKLSWTKKTYTGKNIPAPKVTVTDQKGKKLTENVDYVIYDLYNKLPVGRYEAYVQFEGRYKGGEYVHFTIVPQAPKTVTAELCGYNDVKVSWSKSTGASGYTVYYRKAGTKKYSYLTRTSSLYTKKASDLEAGKKYEFKVVPYFQSGEKRYKSLHSAKDGVYTLKRLSRPKLSTKDKKVKISWKNIAGETGYQISRSSRKSGTNIVCTVKSSKAKSKIIKAKKGKTYYYKVRAFKTIKLNGKTKRIYGPWSKTKKYKR